MLRPCFISNGDDAMMLKHPAQELAVLAVAEKERKVSPARRFIGTCQANQDVIGGFCHIPGKHIRAIALYKQEPGQIIQIDIRPLCEVEQGDRYLPAACRVRAIGWGGAPDNAFYRER